jgi:hypothetical protein
MPHKASPRRDLFLSVQFWLSVHVFPPRLFLTYTKHIRQWASTYAVAATPQIPNPGSRIYVVQLAMAP